MSKEYLDKNKLREILEIIVITSGGKEEDVDFDYAIDQICQLKPKNYISNKELKELKKYGSLMQKDLIKLRKERFESKNQKVIAEGKLIAG